LSAAPEIEISSITIKQLLERETLRGAVVEGDESILSAEVDDVSISSTPSLANISISLQRKLLIFDASNVPVDSYQVDILIREALNKGAVALVLVNYGPRMGLAPIRLAKKFSFPLIIISGIDALHLADDLRKIIRAPFVERSDVLLSISHKLRNLSRTDPIESALKVVEISLKCRAALLGPQGALVASGNGEKFDLPKEIPLLPVFVQEEFNGTHYLLQPISLAPRENPSFWLAITIESPNSSVITLASEVLGISVWFFASILIADRLVRERDARFRLGVLNAISATRDYPDPVLLNQLGVLGWKVDGWCTAIHLQLTGEVDSLRVLNGTAEVQRAFASMGFVGALIERPDGWSGWMVERNEPKTNSYATMVENFKVALEKLSYNSAGVKFYLGIGRPRHGILGLQKSLQEANESSTIAQLSGKNSAVQHIDEMGVRRILLGWYASESFSEFANTLLASTKAADQDGELLRTLETYLDCNSSPSETAIALGIHRNTVINRVDKLKTLLKVDLNEPDERLALQLACRVIKRKWEEV